MRDAVPHSHRRRSLQQLGKLMRSRTEVKISLFLVLLSDRRKMWSQRPVYGTAQSDRLSMNWQHHTGKLALIRFKVKDWDMAYQLSKRPKCRKDIDGCKTVFISLNWSPEVRNSRQVLVGELRTKKQNDTTHYYFARKREIVAVKLK